MNTRHAPLRARLDARLSSLRRPLRAETQVVDRAREARFRLRPALEALEPRLLLSADLVPAAPIVEPPPLMALSEPADTQGPQVVASFIGTDRTDLLGFVVIFDEDILPASFDASDVVSILAPDGAQLVSTIVKVEVYTSPFDGSNRVVGIEIAPTDLEGEYVVVLGPGLTDAAGNANAQTELRLRFAPPDLQPVSLSTPPTAEAGTFASLSWTGRNVRPDSLIDSAWSDRIWISTDDQFDATADTVLVDWFVFPAGATATTWTGFAQAVMPSTPGTYWLFLEVNGQRFGDDRDWSDNLLTPGNAIEVTPPARPDLVVTSITAPSEATEGATFDVTWTTRNDGSAETAGPRGPIRSG
jgi:hypothetical protein